LKRPAAHQKDNFPKRIGPVSGPVRFVVRPALAERRAFVDLAQKIVFRKRAKAARWIKERQC
jgi:hypothetical protein